jgi:hypothetical protein
VRAEFYVPNPKGEIRPGWGGWVAIKRGKPAGVLRVPAGAVVEVPGKEDEPNTAVYVYRDGKARLTRVRVGFVNGNEIEVESGLTAEDLVVANPKDLAPKVEVPVEVEKPAPPK